MEPEFSFDEMIELIRCTSEIYELRKLNDIVRRDAYGYSLFHLQLIDQAISMMITYIAKKDAKEMKEIFWFLF